MTDIEWPEGATHRIDERFKKWVEGIEYTYTYSDGEWVLTLPQRSLERYIESEYKHEVIERPKEPETEPYKPEVGEWCEVYNESFERSEWERCEPLFVGKFKVVYNSESCAERVCTVDLLKFRPIKSEREQIIERAIDLCVGCLGNKYESIVETISGVLYDNGLLRDPDE